MIYRIITVLLAGILGGLAWYLGMLLLFTPAQSILANPEWQSEKFLSVFLTEPLPRTLLEPMLLPAGLVLIGIIYAGVYTALEKALPGTALKKGSGFGLCAWALMVPWFEFYLPWNAMREPPLLVFLEAALWLGILQGVGLTIAISHSLLNRLLSVAEGSQTGSEQ